METTQKRQAVPTTSDSVPQGFVKLEPLEMNSYTFSAHRTVLTPELIEQMGQAAQSAKKS